MTILGIDLGTTLSAAAIWRDGDVVPIPNGLGELLTPSAVSVDDDGHILVGRAARERLFTHPDRTTARFKRRMGTDAEVTLGARKFRSEELSAFVLRTLKEDAEAFLGHEIVEAVVTVPAYFNDSQRKATRAAAKLAGLEVRSLLNEPTAAALTYGLGQAEATTFLVFDLGGGTFDVSVLELFEGVVEVRSSTGDNRLGGEDFVDFLIEAFWSRHGTGGDVTRIEAARLQRLRSEAERVKRALTVDTEAVLRFAPVEKTVEWKVTRDEFSQLCGPLLERIRAPLERALRDARIRASELDKVVLAGGASRMPAVRRLVSQLFGRFPETTVDPDLAIAHGAAIQAGLRMQDAALSEIVMTDVCPYTLGVETSKPYGRRQLQEGLYSPIIERNTTVPTSRSIPLTTIFDRQKLVEVKVYQGESRWVKENVYLGRLEVPVPPKPAGEVELDVRFTYDASGLLECEVTEMETGERHRLVLQENAGTLSPDEVEERLAKLADLKLHPRDQAVNRELLARAERIYEELLGEDREVLGFEIAAFTALIDTQDPEKIEHGRLRLNELLELVSPEAVF